MNEVDAERGRAEEEGEREREREREREVWRRTQRRLADLPHHL